MMRDVVEPRKSSSSTSGSLADVVLSLPALAAVRANSRALTSPSPVAPGVAVVELSGHADEVACVDRVRCATAEGPSLWRIARFVREVRRARYDFVIDLHSLSETTLLGYLSGAPPGSTRAAPTARSTTSRTFAPRPPFEDVKKHAVERYMDVLKPLGVEDGAAAAVSRVPRLRPRAEDERAVDEFFPQGEDRRPRRRAARRCSSPARGTLRAAVPIGRFAELAHSLERNDGLRSVLFAGPE
jgi:ADP-heptose:LPS heptosyltransferase